MWFRGWVRWGHLGCVDIALADQHQHDDGDQDDGDELGTSGIAWSHEVAPYMAIPGPRAPRLRGEPGDSEDSRVGEVVWKCGGCATATRSNVWEQG